MFDESQIPMDRLDPLRPDQLANWSHGTALLSAFMPCIQVTLTVWAMLLAIRAHHLIAEGVAAVGGVVDALSVTWRSADYLLPDLTVG